MSPFIDPFSVIFLPGNDASFLRSKSIWGEREEVKAKWNVHSLNDSQHLSRCSFIYLPDAQIEFI